MKTKKIEAVFKPGIKAQILYTEEDIKQFGLYLGDNYKRLKGKKIDEIFDEVFTKDDQTKVILYTEQEVKNLVNQAFIEGGKSSQKPLRDLDINDWFENNKKK